WQSQGLGRGSRNMEAGSGRRPMTGRVRPVSLPFRSPTRSHPLPPSDALIAVVDDDPSVRESLESLIRSAGLRVEAFASAQEFLARPLGDVPSCLVLDLQLPGLSGLDLQKQLAEVNLEIPIVFITGHG